MRAIARILLGLAAFGTMAWVVGSVAPLPPPSGIREKLRAFAFEQDATDVLFFGSSRLYRGLDPRAFDEEAREAGQAVRSFNFAMPSMQPHEANALLRHVLATRPARLRWVLLEWGRFSPLMAPGNYFKERPVFWHDAPETLSVIVSTWRSELSPPGKIDLTFTHVLHFLQRVLSVGRGPAAARALLGDAEFEDAGDPGLARRRGFAPFDAREHRSGPTAEHRERYLAERTAFEASLRNLPRANREAVDLSEAHLSALEAQIAAVRAAGAEPVYIVMPAQSSAPFAYALAEAGIVPHLLAFNDPDRYPDLYEVHARFDRGHLNERGAKLMSRKLARRFVREVVAERAAD